MDDAYRQTFERLRRQFRARGCTPEEAADLAQEAAVRAFVHIRRWGVSGDGLDPLLNRIARNLLIDRYRRTTPHLVPLDSAGDLHDPDQDPSEEVERRQRRHAVQRAIRSLPTRHRAAITYSLSGLTPEEVGHQMGIGRNAADALLHRARRSLKEHLSAVREGAWGLAFAVRVKWDRFTRRSGSEQFVDPSRLNLMQASVGVAAAAVVAVIGVSGVTGSGAPTNADAGGRGIRLSGVAPVAVDSRDAAEVGEAAPPALGDDGSSIRRTYNLGPASGDWGPDGSNNQIRVKDPSNKSGPPLIDLTHRLYPRPPGGELTTSSAGPTLRRLLRGLR